jgi:hypothetical protein
MSSDGNIAFYTPFSVRFFGTAGVIGACLLAAFLYALRREVLRNYTQCVDETIGTNWVVSIRPSA